MHQSLGIHEPPADYAFIDRDQRKVYDVSQIIPSDVAKQTIKMIEADYGPYITVDTANVILGNLSLYESMQGMEYSSKIDRVMSRVSDDRAVIMIAGLDLFIVVDPEEYLEMASRLVQFWAAGVPVIEFRQFIVDDLTHQFVRFSAKDSPPIADVMRKLRLQQPPFERIHHPNIFRK